MNTYNLACPPKCISIGIEGENSFRTINMDVSKLMAEHPDGIATAVFERPDGESYTPANISFADNIVSWVVADEDVAFEGDGAIEYRVIDGDIVGKAPMILVNIAPGVKGSEEIPSPPKPDWTVVAEKIKKLIGNLDNLETETKKNLVAAINEVLSKGGGGSAILAMRVEGGYIQYTTDNKTWKNLIAVSELKGAKGDAFTYEDFTPEQLAALKGAPGQDGADGAPGEDGADGADGKSAYEIAVDNGFDGTEAEWLASLKGADGQDGAPGADGQNGEDGADGANGKSAYEIAVEQGFVGTKAEWLASLKGADGADGQPRRATVTLAAASWANKAQTVTVQGVSADETAQLIQPVPASASMAAYYDAGVIATGQAENSLTFSCEEVPTADLTVYVVITEVSADA